MASSEVTDVDDICDRFSRRLRELREAQGLSQERLAAAAGGMSRAFVGALERGAKEPGIRTIGKLARALGVDPAELVRGDRQQSPRRPGDRAKRLGVLVESLATGCTSAEAKRFEGIARAFFDRNG